MNTKMTTNSQLLTTKHNKTKQNKNKLSKLEQEQNHRNGDHMEGYQLGVGAGMGGRVQGIRSTIGRYKQTGGG